MRETLSSIISPPISRNLPFIRSNKATLSMMAPLTLTLTTMSPGQCSSTVAMGCSIRPSKGRSIPLRPGLGYPFPAHAVVMGEPIVLEAFHQSHLELGSEKQVVGGRCPARTCPDDDHVMMGQPGTPGIGHSSPQRSNRNRILGRRTDRGRRTGPPRRTGRGWRA